MSDFLYLSLGGVAKPTSDSKGEGAFNKRTVKHFIILIQTVWVLSCLEVRGQTLIRPDSVCFSQDLILDQTIEKVSFCAPDRNFERAFSYICRDGTTRRWICHCFMAVKDSVSPERTKKKTKGVRGKLQVVPRF